MCINKIKYYRQFKKITLKQLAETTGLSISYLSRLKNHSSTSPTFKSMPIIVKALDKSMHEIFDIKEGD